MAKVKYTKCDVCDCQIQNDRKASYYKKGFRLFIGTFFHYDMIDICDDCLMKIRQMKRDINLEDMVCNEVIDQAFTKHSDPILQTAYLEGGSRYIKLFRTSYAKKINNYIRRTI